MAGLYITNAANRASDAANRAQERINEQGQFTERFTTAIDQLGQEGADKLDLRLGGIYALGRLMRDSAVDEPSIIAILVAFLAAHAPLSRTLLQQASTPQDVAAALTVIAHRPNPNPDPHISELANLGASVSIANASLRYADLSVANLPYSNLSAADLTGANLSGTNLSGVNLSLANLSGARLTDAKLFGTHLAGAILSSAALHYAILHGAGLRGAQLRGADLTNADLGGVDLTDADLYGADLTNADLTGALGVTPDQVGCANHAEQARLPSGVTVGLCRTR